MVGTSRNMQRCRLLRVPVFLLALGRAVAGQQPSIPLRPLGPIVAQSVEPMGTAALVRPLAGGGVLVNDVQKRQLIVYDSTLQHSIVVADTTAATRKAYGSGLSALVPFTGDSSLVVDQLSLAYLIIDPEGKIARVVPAPTLANRFPPSQPRAADQAGHLLFAAPPVIYLSLLPNDFIGDTLMYGPDSVPVLRGNIATRKLDTVAMLRAPRARQVVTRHVGGGSGHPAVNPMPSSDDWTVMSDGTIAVVRVGDYHVDWIRPDGRVSAGPKIPTQWVRITDSMKVAMIESVRGRNATTVGGQPAMYVQPSDLPDYRPPFLSGFARGDAEGHVWVRENPAAPAAGGAVYDVIDRAGGLVDRVQLPTGSSLVGFGPGVAYLSLGGRGATQLAKAKIR